VLRTALTLAVALTLVVPATPALAADSGRHVLLYDHHVVVTTSKPGGITSIEIYETVDSASAKGLAKRLGGVSTLQAPYYECATAYGGAQFISNTSYCITPYSWTYGGYARPQVYFNDHTPSQWPVSQSVSTWNQSIAIDSWWTTSCPSPLAGRHCVDVWNADYGTAWQGYTAMDVDANNHFIDGSVVVHLNDHFWSTDDNRGTTCHELGHALGLAHNRTNRSSCIFKYSIDGPDPRYPSADDFSVLADVIY
jgi:hypothetical protein